MNVTSDYPVPVDSFAFNGSSVRARDSTDSIGYAYTSYRDSLTTKVSKKKMTNTVRASNKAAILAVGEELRLLLHEEDPPLIKDRRYHLKVYEKSFVGHDMVDWLLKKGEVESRDEAIAMMQKLLDHGVVHHVCDDHTYKDEKLFYRFRKDDGTYKELVDSAIIAKGQRLYSRLKGDGSGLVQDRKYHLTTYKRSFIGKDFVDWLLAKGEASSRPEAIDVGRQLLEAGVFKHVCSDHHFKDEVLYYRFKNDDVSKSSPHLRDRLSSKKGSKLKRGSQQQREEDSGSMGDSNDHRESGGSWDSSASGDHTRTPQRNSPEPDEYIHMQSNAQNRPSSGSSPHDSPSMSSSSHSPTNNTTHTTNGAVTAAVNTTATRVKPSIEELTDPNGRFYRRSVDVVSDPVGYGFVIRGSKPVYVHTVDPSGPAAASGLKLHDYLYSVNGQVTLHASHTDAARIILMGTSTASLVVFTERGS